MLFTEVLRRDPQARHFLFHDVDVWEKRPGHLHYYKCLHDGVTHLYGFGVGELDILFKTKDGGKPCLGGIFCMPASKFQAVDGFSNGFEGWGHEDVDMGSRVLKKGFQVDASKIILRTDAPRTIHDDIHYGFGQVWAEEGRIGVSESGLSAVQYKVKEYFNCPGVSNTHVMRVERLPAKT